MQQWEYHVELVDISGFWGPNVDPSIMSRMFNKAGNDGWEIVGIVDINSGNGASSRLLVTFKRLRQLNQ